MEPLPVALQSIAIRDFRGIGNLELDFRGPDGLPNQLVVLAGPNGSGKTAVLEAALLAAGGERLVVGSKGRAAVRKGADDFEIEATFRTNEGGRTVAVTSGGLKAEPLGTVPHWYFSSWRAPVLIGALDVSVGKPGRRPRRNDANRLRNVKQLLVNAAAKARFASGRPSFLDQSDEWLAAINQAWATFHPGSPGRFEVDLAEADTDGRGGFDLYYVPSDANRLEVDYLVPPDANRLEVDHLSAGQLELFLFVAALVLNDSRSGIVFIDEPELHLDPQWHRPILRTLVRLQPRAQFIVATHSTEIYDAARSYERHFLVPADDPRARHWQSARSGA